MREREGGWGKEREKFLSNIIFSIAAARRRTDFSLKRGGE